jgi:phosphosulfolactate phosphohydrolase-like enzyme
LAHNSLSDAAVLVKSLYREANTDLPSYLRQSRNGRALAGIGKAQDVEECARLSVTQTVGVMQGDAIVKFT